MSKKDGGPASEKTLRDYFAASVVRSFMDMDAKRSGIAVDNDLARRIARLAYAMADAMLEERER